ncbi:hypothetical protein P872_17370 [Rhodonellum psychrophilum GCM71 = DSM 17998]|uniref:Uncharacterized protein n=1 Tax=Rhodonellum psychrophilum GCM71 = DSM 17998 TaxID=1123057 RepID=U5BZ35_9BACT|nr:hypothetical protein P872_17370 [Rhodonellum psychrophilum GCM71 = DSM 17998]
MEWGSSIFNQKNKIPIQAQKTNQTYLNGFGWMLNKEEVN